MVKEVASVADEKNQDTTTNMFIFNKQNNEKVSNNQPWQGVFASLKVQNLMFFCYILLRYTVFKKIRMVTAIWIKQKTQT